MKLEEAIKNLITKTFRGLQRFLFEFHGFLLKEENIFRFDIHMTVEEYEHYMELRKKLRSSFFIQFTVNGEVKENIFVYEISRYKKVFLDGKEVKTNGTT